MTKIDIFLESDMIGGQILDLLGPFQNKLSDLMNRLVLGFGGLFQLLTNLSHYFSFEIVWELSCDDCQNFIFEVVAFDLQFIRGCATLTWNLSIVIFHEFLL